MFSSLDILTLTGVICAGLSGICGLIYDVKDSNGNLTSNGKKSIIGLFLALAVSIFCYFLSVNEQRINEKNRIDEIEKLLTNQQQVMGEIQKTQKEILALNYPLKGAIVNVVYEFIDPKLRQKHLAYIKQKKSEYIQQHKDEDTSESVADFFYNSSSLTKESQLNNEIAIPNLAIGLSKTKKLKSIQNSCNLVAYAKVKNKYAAEYKSETNKYTIEVDYSIYFKKTDGQIFSLLQIRDSSILIWNDNFNRNKVSCEQEPYSPKPIKNQLKLKTITFHDYAFYEKYDNKKEINKNTPYLFLTNAKRY